MTWLCRWGMHLPGSRKVFHRGHLFTRCSDCGTTLIKGAKGWRDVPIGKRVIWRDKTGNDRMFVESANFSRERTGFDLRSLFRRR